ncbi:type II toxin-antitoxin system VapC family toxin [Candidatus Shapirobacteria bacterium]|nr:type II toxin-antitoxin system VapC family toxin [Candidatus Shapirobacteria bacterium]
MKRVVFDTSVAIKWFFPESGKEKALELKDSHAAGEIRLCTRDLFLYEFTSCLKNYTMTKIKGRDFSLAAVLWEFTVFFRFATEKYLI